MFLRYLLTTCWAYRLTLTTAGMTSQGNPLATVAGMTPSAKYLAWGFDLFVLVIFLVAAYYGYERGLLSQLVSTPISIGLFFLGVNFFLPVKQVIADFLIGFGYTKPDEGGGGTNVASTLTFLFLLFFLFFLFVVLEWMIKYIINRTFLIYFDRPMGIVICVLQIAFFLSAAIYTVESYDAKLGTYGKETLFYEPLRDLFPRLKTYATSQLPEESEYYERAKALQDRFMPGGVPKPIRGVSAEAYPTLQGASSEGEGTPAVARDVASPSTLQADTTLATVADLPASQEATSVPQTEQEGVVLAPVVAVADAVRSAVAVEEEGVPVEVLSLEEALERCLVGWVQGAALHGQVLTGYQEGDYLRRKAAYDYRFLFMPSVWAYFFPTYLLEGGWGVRGLLWGVRLLTMGFPIGVAIAKESSRRWVLGYGICLVVGALFFRGYLYFSFQQATYLFHLLGRGGQEGRKREVLCLTAQGSGDRLLLEGITHDVANKRVILSLVPPSGDEGDALMLTLDLQEVEAGTYRVTVAWGSKTSEAFLSSASMTYHLVPVPPQEFTHADGKTYALVAEGGTAPSYYIALPACDLTLDLCAQDAAGKVVPLLALFLQGGEGDGGDANDASSTLQGVGPDAQ